MEDVLVVRQLPPRANASSPPLRSRLYNEGGEVLQLGFYLWHTHCTYRILLIAEPQGEDYIGIRARVQVQKKVLGGALYFIHSFSHELDRRCLQVCPLTISSLCSLCFVAFGCFLFDFYFFHFNPWGFIFIAVWSRSFLCPNLFPLQGEGVKREWKATPHNAKPNAWFFAFGSLVWFFFNLTLETGYSVLRLCSELYELYQVISDLKGVVQWQLNFEVCSYMYLVLNILTYNIEKKNRW